MTEKLILASGSFIRRQMLEKAGLNFQTEDAKVDEDSLKVSLIAEGASPRDIADTLAEMKALRVSGRHPGTLVIGSDQVLEFNGEILSKPASISQARGQISSLRGRSHKLLSAVVIVRDGHPIWRHVGDARLSMRDFSDQYLDDYLSRNGDSCLASVGGYKLEEEGVRLFEKIEGDYFTILGMPLIELLNYLTTTKEIQA